jgi:hypothetical protein
MKWLCKIGIHRPLFGHYCTFVDKISQKDVFKARCFCGRRWLTDSVFGWLGFKVEIFHKEEE